LDGDSETSESSPEGTSWLSELYLLSTRESFVHLEVILASTDELGLALMEKVSAHMFLSSIDCHNVD
jgi:hypothetical protein